MIWKVQGYHLVRNPHIALLILADGLVGYKRSDGGYPHQDVVPGAICSLSVVVLLWPPLPKLGKTESGPLGTCLRHLQWS